MFLIMPKDTNGKWPWRLWCKHKKAEEHWLGWACPDCGARRWNKEHCELYIRDRAIWG